jgi:hypothetical protein
MATVYKCCGRLSRQSSQRRGEVDMTLCIAAFAINGWKMKGPEKMEGPKINVCVVFDKRIETSTSGAEIAFKFKKVSANWAALIAGNVSRAEELLSLYTSNLPSEPIPDTELLDELRKPPQTFKRRLAEEYVQNMIGISYGEFLSTGRASLPASLFENIAYDVAKLDIACQLILIPVAPQSQNHLFIVDSDGSVSQDDNFCAVGTGANGATAWLHYRGQHKYNDLQTTCRHLIEAKKFCETAPGVGKKTHLIQIGDDNSMQYVSNETVFDKTWNQSGPRKSTRIKIDLQNYGGNPGWKDTGIG